MEQQYGEIAHADLRAEHVYTKVNGQRIHCVVAGKGQPVLLIPGWPQTWYTWRHVMRALAAAGFQAIAVDPPGIGDSDKPRDGYDTGSIAVMLHTMMTQLGHSRYRLVGHDVGMWIGYAMASDFPQAVERLVEHLLPGGARFGVVDAGVDHRPAVAAVDAVAQQPEVDVIQRKGQHHAQPLDARRDADGAALRRQLVGQGVVQGTFEFGGNGHGCLKDGR